MQIFSYSTPATTKLILRSIHELRCKIMIKLNKEQVLVTAGGKITCQRCQAMSKRTRNQCRAPAMRNKNVCRIHGGKSTGPRTIEGKLKASEPHTKFGNDTRDARIRRRAAMSNLRKLEGIAVKYGFFCGSKSPGRKFK